jgi:hypothetical protein
VISGITIERKAPDARRHAAIIRQRLLAADTLTVTAPDAARITGLPIDACREALLTLYGDVPAEIRVDAGGDMQFHFASLRHRRPSVRPSVAARGLDALATWYRRHADVLLILITMPLAPPFLFALFGNLQAFVRVIIMGDAGLAGWQAGLLAPLLIVALPALLVSGIGACLTILTFQALPLASLLLLVSAPVLVIDAIARNRAKELLVIGPLALVMVAVGLPLALFCWEKLKEAIFDSDWGRQTWTTVGRLLFGPRSETDALSDERRLTALIGQREGVLCRSDVMALFGWTPSQADRELTRILLDYGGEIAVTPKGAVLYRFGLHGGDDADVRPLYERGPGLRPFWGFPRIWQWLGAGTVLAALLGLALHPRLTLLPDVTTWAHLWGLRRDKEGLALLEGFGAWPYLLIAVPNLVRLIPWSWARWAWRRRQAWMPLLQLATEHPEGGLMKAVDTKRLSALGGTIDPERSSGTGEVWVHFPGQVLERHEADVARASLRQGARSLTEAMGAETV